MAEKMEIDKPAPEKKDGSGGDKKEGGEKKDPVKDATKPGEEKKKKKKRPDLDVGDSKRKNKEEAEFSQQVEKELPEQLALAKSGKPGLAIEKLYALEKQTRNGGDAISTAKVVTAIVEICWEAKDFRGLLDNLQLLAKKRGQLKQAITAMVQKAMTYLDKFSDADAAKKMELLETLRTITEGKIYVENERARLTHILALIREKEGKIKEAADILQEVQVETYGSMEKKEKTEFILEQVRLCLDSNDFVRAQILARKINVKVLLEAGFEDVKLKYYNLMIRYHTSEANNLEIAKDYQAIYDTPKVKAGPEQWKAALKLLTLYICLSPHDNEQSDFIHRLFLDKNLEDLPPYRELVRFFLTKEIMSWPNMESLYKAELASLPPFANPENAKKLWEQFHKRVVEHNIRIVSNCYARITLNRLSELLFLNNDETEQFLSDLVSSKSIWARIDRPKGVVSFFKRKEPADVLNEWSHDVSELLERVEKTCHLIHRENMVHKI